MALANLNQNGSRKKQVLCRAGLSLVASGKHRWLENERDWNLLKLTDYMPRLLHSSEFVRFDFKVIARYGIFASQYRMDERKRCCEAGIERRRLDSVDGNSKWMDRSCRVGGSEKTFPGTSNAI